MTTRPVPSSQRGVVMYVAIVVLLAMMLAGVAMIRQMGTGVSIAGNIAFRQNATNVADLGTEAALTYIGGATWIDSNDDAHGAYNSSDGGVVFDPFKFDWNNKSLLVTADDGTGNEVRYVIHRLCTQTGAVDAANQSCVSEPAEDEERGGCARYGCEKLTRPPDPYFRITTRVLGPRNTLSYIQTIVQR